jgi:uncharacterized membrane protein YvbJ
MICINCGRKMPCPDERCEFCSKDIELGNIEQTTELAESELNKIIRDNSHIKFKKSKKFYIISLAVIIGIILFAIGSYVRR